MRTMFALAASSLVATAVPEQGIADPQRLLAGCVDAMRGDPLMAPLLFASDDEFGTHRAQLLLGVVDESTDPPTLTRESVRADEAYFYPASTVKLFVAVGALLRLQELQRTGIPVDADTPLVFRPMFEGEALEAADESNTETGSITIRHEIRKLFIVSDNRAFNRLLGFVGRDDLNRMMHDAGLASVRLNHRLSVGYSPEQNRRMPRVDMLAPDGSIHTIPERLDPPITPTVGVPMLEAGEAEMVGGERRAGPKDFSRSNRVSLRDLQDALVMVLRPDVDLGKAGFPLTDAHRALLVEAMTTLPRESANPVYDPETYGDDYVKFILPGLRRVLDPGRVRVANKIGLAYGFTTITSAVVLDDRPPTVFATGTLYTNANATLNDNVYEYETVAFPYWAALGEHLARLASAIHAPGSPVRATAPDTNADDLTGETDHD